MHIEDDGTDRAELSTGHGSTEQPPWRNRLARSAVNRKVGGSSPPGGAKLFFYFAIEPMSVQQ